MPTQVRLIHAARNSASCFYYTDETCPCLVRLNWRQWPRARNASRSPTWSFAPTPNPGLLAPPAMVADTDGRPVEWTDALTEEC